MIFKKAFTLAEVLITLTIIGIIAAMVIPSLMADVNEKAFDTQRKALYARMSQAIPSMPKIAGYGTLTGTLSSGNTAQSVTTDTAAETFVTEGLSKVIKMNNMCYSDNISECGFPSSFTAMGGTTINLSSILTLNAFNPLMISSKVGGTAGNHEQLNTKAAAFETANGESILVYYNPNCQADLKETAWHFAQSEMCANLVYDLNGEKAPNTVGKDIGFITVMYSTNPVVVSPMPLSTNAGDKKQTEALAACKAQDSESRLPSKDEVAAMFYNMKLIGVASGDLWSGSVVTSGASGTAWDQSFNDGRHGRMAKTTAEGVRCVKK